MKITLSKEEVESALKAHVVSLLFENGNLEIEFDEYTTIFEVTVEVKIGEGEEG